MHLFHGSVKAPTDASGDPGNDPDSNSVLGPPEAERVRSRAHRRWRQRGLGKLTPIEFETIYNQTALAA